MYDVTACVEEILMGYTADDISEVEISCIREFEEYLDKYPTLVLDAISTFRKHLEREKVEEGICPSCAGALIYERHVYRDSPPEEYLTCERCGEDW